MSIKIEFPRNLKSSEVADKIFQILKIDTEEDLQVSFKGIYRLFGRNDHSAKHIEETLNERIEKGHKLSSRIRGKESDGIITLNQRGVRRHIQDIRALIDTMLFMSYNDESSVKGKFNDIEVLVEKNEKRSSDKIMEQYFKDFDSQAPAKLN